MSLPPAPKDISDHPRAGSVVDPVNQANKEADVDRKIRLYGVVEAFRQGRMPNNQQIDQTLKYVLDNSPVDLKALSPDGQRLVSDTRDIIETARVIVAEKNADELFQNFVWHTRDVDVDAAKKDPNEVLPVDKEKVQNDGQEAVKHLRTLLTLIATNSEVRKLLSDFTLIGRDLLARGAAKVTDAIRPDQEALVHVDESAPYDQFITEGGRVAAPGETPVLEAKVPGATVVHNPKEGTKVKTADGKALTPEQVADQAKGQAQDVVAQTNGVQNGGTETEVKKQGLISKFRNLGGQTAEKIPQEHKDKVSQKIDRTKQFLSEEYFPEERRDQFIYRGKKVIIECQKHDDYQESLRWLISYLEEYTTHAHTLASATKDSGSTLKHDPSLRQATSELTTLLERFANGRPMSTITEAVNLLITDAKNDAELRGWFHGVDVYIRKVLLDAGYVLEPDCNNRGNALRESGRRFYEEKYKGNFDGLFNAVGGWFKAMGEDPLNKRFADDWARLTKDLLFDEEGGLKFKPELWGDVRKVIVPALVDKVGYIPIPRIEYTDDTLDLVIENLTLSGRNLFPNHVALEAHNYMKFSPYDAISDSHHHEFKLTLGQVQADMRDVAFYFRKKTGIPKLSDSGLADVLLGGEGLTATIYLVSADKDHSSVFKVKYVNVKVDTLKFSIRDSKHDFLYKTLRPLVTGLIKKQIQKALSDAITTGLEYVDGQLLGVRERMAAAKVAEGQSRTAVLQDMFSRKKEEAQVKAAQKVSGSQFKVVANKRNSMLANAGSPAGWVNRVGEKEEVVGHGKDWRSDAFTVVGA